MGMIGVEAHDQSIDVARAEPYDELPYGGAAVPASHPDVLALVARRHGLRPAPPATARVLELGCAEGANLLPLAFRLEGAACVGLDASSAQLEVAREARDRLGLDNLELVCARIENVDPAALGAFDYVICHGVLSWVAPEVRTRLLSVVRAVLAPGGVAFVSFNCRPGWCVRALLRSALLARTAGAKDVAEALARARALLELLASSPGASSPYGALLAEEARRLLQKRDAYLRHEYLAEHNHAFTWGEISDLTAASGLSILEELGRAAPDRRAEEALSLGLREQLGDAREGEELTELMLFRAFRMVVLARADDAPAGAPSDDPASLASMHLAGRVRPRERRASLDPDVSELFETDDGVSVASSDPMLKAALLEIARSWPASVSGSELAERVHALLELRRVVRPAEALDPARIDALGRDLLELCRLGHLYARSAPVAPLRSSPAPRVSALTRWEAQRRPEVTGPYHQLVVLDPLTRALIGVLDGSRDRDALVAHAAELLGAGDVVLRDVDGEPLDEHRASELLPELVDRSIAALAGAGMLTG